MRRSHAAVAGVVVVTTALAVVAVVSTAVHPSASVVALTAAEIVLAGISVVSGLLLARSVAGRRFASAVALPGLVAALALTGEVLNRTAGRPPGDEYVTAASQGAWVLVFVAIAVVVLAFPSGRADGRPTRWIRVLLLVDAGAFMVVAATAPGPYPSGTPGLNLRGEVGHWLRASDFAHRASRIGLRPIFVCGSCFGRGRRADAR